MHSKTVKVTTKLQEPKMFLINSLIQNRKFAGPFLLSVYRVCKKSMVLHYFCHPVHNF